MFDLFLQTLFHNDRNQCVLEPCHHLEEFKNIQSSTTSYQTVLKNLPYFDHNDLADAVASQFFDWYQIDPAF